MIYDLKFVDCAVNFDLKKALSGYPLAASSDSYNYISVEEFTQISSDKFSGKINGEVFYFNRSGLELDGSLRLTMASSTIEKNTSLSGDSADSENSSGSDTIITENTTATVGTLSSRDYFAQQALNGLIQKVDKPFDMTDADIYKLTILSYRMAQSMLNVAAYNRASDPIEEEGEGEETPEITPIHVNPGMLSTPTEVLLYNLSVAFDKLNTTIQTYLQGDGEGEVLGLQDVIDAVENSGGSGGSGLTQEEVDERIRGWLQLTADGNGNALDVPAHGPS